MGCSLEILDQGTRFTEAAFGAREWSLVDGYLILRAGAGKETRLRPVTLVDFDGKAFDPAPSLTFRTNRRVSGNIGCLITGDYFCPAARSRSTLSPLHGRFDLLERLRGLDVHDRLLPGSRLPVPVGSLVRLL